MAVVRLNNGRIVADGIVIDMPRYVNAELTPAGTLLFVVRVPKTTESEAVVKSFADDFVGACEYARSFGPLLTRHRKIFTKKRNTAAHQDLPVGVFYVTTSNGDLELRVSDPVTLTMRTVDNLDEAHRVREDMMREYVRTYAYE